MIIEGLRERWDRFNEVDSYGVNGPGALAGLALMPLLIALDNPVGRRLVASTIGFALDVTNYLEPRVKDITDRFGDARDIFGKNDWREVQLGPLSGSVLVSGDRVNEVVRDYQRARGFAFRLRLQTRDLLRGLIKGQR